jgi:hypothetical protein
MLHTVSIWFLIFSGITVIILAVDVMRHPQKMAVMNWVWPITALYFGPFALWSYYNFGRQKDLGNKEGHKEEQPYWQKVWKGVTHCGAGCTLGDIIAEWSMRAWHLGGY